MNSTENVLKNFEWECDTTVGFARGQGYMGVGVSRTIFLHPNIEDIPEQLFAVKVSQSTNQQKAGKIVFRFLSTRFAENQAPTDLVPNGIDMTTPLDQVKAIAISKVKSMQGASMSLNIGLKGKFTTIACADGNFKLYDEDEPEFKTDDPNTTGNAPYYIKSDAVIHVKLKGADSKQGNPYIQTTFSSTAASSEIFVKPQKGAIWNPDGVSQTADASQGTENMESVW